jgi:hypothetical protein
MASPFGMHAMVSFAMRGALPTQRESSDGPAFDAIFPPQNPRVSKRTLPRSLARWSN